MIQHGRGHDFIEKTNGFLRFLLFHCCVVALMSWSIFDRFWDPLGLKNRSKIDKNWIQKSKNWYNFWSILEPTWLHFGEVLGAKLGPSWLQNRSKKQSKNQSNVESILYRFFIDFGAQEAPKSRGPICATRTYVGSWSQDGPKTPQDPPKTPPRPPKMEPRWPQDPPT